MARIPRPDMKPRKEMKYDNEVDGVPDADEEKERESWERAYGPDERDGTSSSTRARREKAKAEKDAIFQNPKKRRAEKSQSAAVPKPVPPALPLCISPDGPAANAILEGAGRVKAGESDEAKRLLRRVSMDIRAIKQSYQGEQSLWAGKVSEDFNLVQALKEESPPCALVRQGDGYYADTSEQGHNDFHYPDWLLRYAIALKGGLEHLAAGMRGKALRGYMERPQEYDLVLGGFVPEELRRDAEMLLPEATEREAVARYTSGANDTAADDYAVYLRIKATERKRRATGLLRGFPTGLPTLDAYTGGLHGVTVLGGKPGSGKTALALHVSRKTLEDDPEAGVLFFSLDMEKTELLDRITSSKADVPYAKLYSSDLSQEESKRIEKAEGEVQGLIGRMRIVNTDKPLTAESIREYADALKEAAGVKRILVVVDYFGLMPVPEEVGGELEADHYRLEQLQRFQRGSRTAERPGGDTVLVVAQVRKAGGEGDLVLEDVKGSADIGYFAHLVLLLGPSEQEGTTDTARLSLRIAKGRDGVTRGQVELLFRHKVTRFEEAGAGPVAETKARAGTARKPAAPDAGKAKKGRNPLAGH